MHFSFFTYSSDFVIFLSIEDFSSRAKVNGTLCTLMADMGLLKDLPRSNQLSLFDL